MVRRLYLVAFAVRVLAGLIGYIATEDFGIPLLQDALYYEEVGYGVAQDWLSGRSSDWIDTELYGGRVAWLMVGGIGVLYYALQGFRSVPFLLVLYSSLTALVPVYAYRISRELDAPVRVARRAAFIIALTPAFVFWSGALYKEGAILLVLSMAVYHTLRLQRTWGIWSLAVVIVSVFALLGLRFYLAPLMAGSVILGLLFSRDAPATRGGAGIRAPALLRQGVLVVLFVGTMATIGFTERAERSLMETDSGFLVQLDVSRRDLATTAQSGYLPDVSLSEPGDAARFFPIGLLYFLTVPLPWQLGSLRQNITIPETFVWVLAYPLVLRGLIRGLSTNRGGTGLLILITTGICSVYAVLSGNVGIAYRMRTQVWLFWAPFAVWGWEAWRERRSGRGSTRPGLNGKR